MRDPQPPTQPRLPEMVSLHLVMVGCCPAQPYLRSAIQYDRPIVYIVSICVQSRCHATDIKKANMNGV